MHEICSSSEKTFSEHLDLFDIEWIYEPVSFPLSGVVGQLKKCLHLIFTYHAQFVC